MIIVIENCCYDNFEITPFLRANNLLDEKGKVRVIGYLYSKELKDCVFFLPKVILDKDDKVLGKYEPSEVLLGIDNEKDKVFLYSFSMWLYRSINRYAEENKDNKIVQKRTLSNIDSSVETVNVTFVDIILAIEQFAKKNKGFLLFTMQHLNSGCNTILWRQTVTHKQPIIRKEKAPIYLDFFTKKRIIDQNEELLIIFFSILRYINKKYGSNFLILSYYDLIPDHLFEEYLNGYGLLRLQEIKYKYFSDKTLRIWQLSYAFFEKVEQLRSSTQIEDYLLAYKFDRIFEAMVDDLIGFKQEELPDIIKKKQEDDKIIDHIFIYKSLTNPNKKTYYIADSKYYPTGKRTEGASFFKQYTYARNLRHEIMSELRKQREEQKCNKMEILCLDDKTEGYDIIPNFFLSAYIDDKYDYDDDCISRRESQDESFLHFPNRLFDRETLFLSHYDINFLYVIKQYAIDNADSIKVFRLAIYHKFRSDILNRLNYMYDFYLLRLKEGKSLSEALEPIFYRVNGKVFDPQLGASGKKLILALENPGKAFNTTKYSQLEKIRISEENQLVLEIIKKDFYITENGAFKLGDDLDFRLTAH